MLIGCARFRRETPEAGVQCLSNLLRTPPQTSFQELNP